MTTSLHEIIIAVCCTVIVLCSLHLAFRIPQELRRRRKNAKALHRQPANDA